MDTAVRRMKRPMAPSPLRPLSRPIAPAPAGRDTTPRNSASDLYLATDQYRAFIPVKHVRGTDTRLYQLYEKGWADKRFDDQGCLQTRIKGAYPGTYHLIYYLEHRSIPHSVPKPDLNYLEQTAASLEMADLLEEVQLYYPLREDVRRTSAGAGQQPYLHLSSLLALAAAFAYKAHTDHSSKFMQEALRSYGSIPDQDLLEAAAEEPEVRRSMILFHFPLLRQYSTFGRHLFLHHLHSASPVEQCQTSPVGDWLVQNGLWNYKAVFLQKIRDVLGEAHVGYNAQLIFSNAVAHGQIALAERQASALREQHGTNPVTASLHGVCLRLLARFDEAIAVFDEAFAQQQPHMPVNILAHQAYGDCLAAIGEIEAAVAQYKEAIRAVPYNFAPYVSLSAILHTRGFYEEAEYWRRHLIRLQPSMPRVHFFLAQTLEKQSEQHSDVSRLPEAMNLYEMAERISPEDTGILRRKHALAIKMGDWACAARTQRRIAELEDDQAKWVPSSQQSPSGHNHHLTQMILAKANVKPKFGPFSAQGEHSRFADTTLGPPASAWPKTATSATFAPHILDEKTIPLVTPMHASFQEGLFDGYLFDQQPSEDISNPLGATFETSSDL